VTRLKVTDIDSGRMCIRVEQGKGAKDRYLPLSPRLLVHLREYWRRCRTPLWLFPGHPSDRPLSRHGASHIYATAKAKVTSLKAIFADQCARTMAYAYDQTTLAGRTQPCRHKKPRRMAGFGRKGI